MLKKATLPLSAKQITKMMGNGKITFDNIVQRGLTWETKRKALLIHSMVMGYPIPPFYSARSSAGYDMLDGKQRCNAIADFINGKYKLTELPEVTLENGEEINISKLSFEELPEELQDAIQDYSLNVYYFEDITHEEIIEMFARLNNGKPLTAIELTRVKAKSMEQIKKISSHEIFKESMSEKQLEGYKNEDIVIKSWIALYNDNKSFETKYVRPIVETMEITDEQIKELEDAYERISEAYYVIAHNGDTKHDKKIAKRVYTMTHLISLVPTALRSVKEGQDVDSFAEFVKDFFSPEDKTSISDTYNGCINAGANKRENVENRLLEIEIAYEEFKLRPQQEIFTDKDFEKADTEEETENK